MVMDLIIGVNNMTPIIRSIFILFGGSEYQNQPGYFHCSGERMKKWPVYCPQGSGTLRQQLLHGIALYCIVLHGIAW